MREDKEKAKLIRRYYNKIVKNVPLDEDIKVSVNYDIICKYYIVDLYIPFQRRIARTCVDYKEYLRIKKRMKIKKG